VIPDSMLSGDNAAFLDDQLARYREDPTAVSAEWRALFDDLPAEPVVAEGPGFRPRSIFGGTVASGAVDPAVGRRQAKVVQLINAFRVRGHLDAQIDPLERRERRTHPELTLAYYGLSDADLDAEVDTHPAFGLPARVPLRRLIDQLEKAYCGPIGAEFMNIMDNTQKMWVQEQLETLPNRGVLSPEEERRVFRKLCDAENFERLIHTRFPGTKRFSLEGGETLIPLLDRLIDHAARAGVVEIVMGMAHRGRLNTLVNILDKPVSQVVREFQDPGGATQGSGDVKYHLGYSADLAALDGTPVHVTLTPNPSHLEVVNGIVEGRVRAKQDRVGDTEHRRAMALLLHGDAAFSGQGSVMEVLNLSELSGYRTGGTIHVIVNNQIGFTTPPAEGRSTPYATDIARMLAVPIFHVNGEVPRDVSAVVEMAVAFRQRFQRDVVIDMYCYRKHGHNEGDEPSFTQPKMYEAIRDRPTPSSVYAAHLMSIGTLTAPERDEIHAESYRAIVSEADAPEPPAPRAAGSVPNDAALSSLAGRWKHWSSGTIHDPVDTTFDRARLEELLRATNRVPDDFHPHAKIKRLLKQRVAMLDGERGLDWAVGEQAAYATLIDEGYTVRLSGQDSGRGTFSHRHAVFADVRNAQEIYPLRLLDVPGRFEAIDSSLSELAVLGFEVGYAFDTPDGLILWEAQFGDFANGAQIVIDQYLASSAQKWNRYCGLVLLLPHGYEGQGPEHSSARLERFLLMCAEDNMRVANITTPANFFHLLRQQVLRRVRAPLIVMSPKSLLRHPGATSTLDELADGAFQPVLADPSPPATVRRVVLCTGKVFFELQTRRDALEAPVALLRLELLYPFPADAIREALAPYPDAEVVWTQEEPRNMGAWATLLHLWLDALGELSVRYVGRSAAASPATGSHQRHLDEQRTLIESSLTFPE